MEKKLIDQEGKKKDHQFLFILLSGLSLLLVVGAVLVAVLVPLVNKLPKTIHNKIEFTPSFLEDTSKYVYEDHMLTLNEGDIQVLVTTPNSNSAIGVPSYNYLYAQPDGENSEIYMSFVKDMTKLTMFSVEIYFSDNHGENIVRLNNDQITITSAASAVFFINVKYSSDIYLHHLVFNYDYLAN